MSATTPIRALLVSHARCNPDAGASRVYHLLADGLTARGHSVTVLHFEDFGVPASLLSLTMRFLLPKVASRRAVDCAWREFDVIMASNGTLYPLFEQFRHSWPRPVFVNHIHGLNFFDHQAEVLESLRGHRTMPRLDRLITGRIHARWDIRGSNSADLTIVQNKRDFDYLSATGVKELTRIPLSVHPDIFDAGLLAPLPQSRMADRLLWFGSWIPRKGIHYLPRAFQEIVKHCPNARLTLGATGLPASVLRNEFDSSLRERIDIMPRLSRREQIELFSRHALFLFPSLSEGFGYAMLEAMAMGLAVIATQTGMGADHVVDYQHCRVIPTASSTHLAEACVELIMNADLRGRIVQNGRNLAMQFSTERFVDAYEAAMLSRVHIGRPLAVRSS